MRAAGTRGPKGRRLAAPIEGVPAHTEGREAKGRSDVQENGGGEWQIWY